jgi:hypothetical protein
MAHFSWSLLRIIGITGDSGNPGVQDPDEHVSTERIICVAKRYALVEGDLYRCGANGVLMRCITREDGYELLIEIHGGECGNHASSCTLVSKAF